MLAFLLISNVLAAQISGKVQELGTTVAIPEAKIEVFIGETLFTETTTDSDGSFILQLDPGEYQFQISCPEHTTLLINEKIKQRDRNRIYRLGYLHDGAVVVWGTKLKEEVSKQVFSIDELQDVPGSFGDPVRALQSLPGIARPSMLEGSLVVRGAEGLNTSSYIDGMPVPYLFHLLVGKSVVNPAFIEDVEFLPGGMPSTWGFTSQAAVNVITREQTQGRSLLIDLNVLDLSGAIDARPSPSIRFTGALRYSWVGGIVGAFTKINSGNAYIYPAYWDLFLSAEAKTNLGRLSIVALGSGDKLSISNRELIESSIDSSHLIDAGFGRFRIRHEHNKGLHRAETWIAGGPKHRQNLIGDMLVNLDGPWFGAIEGWNLLGRREDRFDIGQTSMLITGVELDVGKSTYSDLTHAFDLGQITEISENRQFGAVFSEFQWRRRPDGARQPWFISAGVRFNTYNYSDISENIFEPRLTITRNLTDTFSLKLFGGRFSQAPPEEANAMSGPLPVTTTYQTTAGIEWSKGPWELSSNIYATQMNNLIVREIISTYRSESQEKVSQTGIPNYFPVQGYSTGIETLLRLNPGGNWWGWAVLNIGRSHRIQDGEIWPSDYDEPVSLTIIAAWQGPLQWRFSSRFRFTSGHPYTPQQGVYNPVDDSYAAWEGERSSARFPNFHQLDLRIERTWRARRADWTFYFDIFNIYWAKNPWSASYNYDYSEVICKMYLPTIPTLGLEIRY